MEKDILADIQKEGEPINFQMNEEKDTPTESQPEEEPKDDEKDEPQEGDSTPQETKINFHEHPRWIQRENELKELRERDEQRARELAELKAFKEEISTKVNSTGEIPEWFRELYGDNVTAYQKYAQHETKREQDIEKRVLERQEKVKQQQAEQIAYWNNWINRQIQDLREAGNEFDDNELRSVMTKFSPRDANGNLDFKKGYEIYTMTKPQVDPKSVARKQIADTASSRSKEKAPKNYMTPNDLRNTPWQSL